MNRKRKRLLKIVIGAIVIAVALFAVMQIVNVVTTKKVDTSEGIGIIEEQEKQDVQSIESKIQRMDTQEKADSEEADSSTGGKRTNKQIFVNSVVIGDSITGAFIDYDVLDAASVISKVGGTVGDLKDSFETMEQMNPDAIFLSYGMNDIVETKGNVDEFEEQYRDAIDELKNKLPNSRVFVNSIFPVQKSVMEGQTAYKNVDEFNEMLERLCDEEQITFIDNSDLVKTQYYDEDGIHFKADFYPVWAAHMAEVALL